MASGPRDRLEIAKGRIRELSEDGTISNDCRDHLLEFADALDEKTVRHTFHDVNGNIKTLKPLSIKRYLNCLRLCAESGLDLLSCSAADFNDIIAEMHDVEGKAKTTLTGYQVAAQNFYRYHDLVLDPEEIEHFSVRSEPKHDELDMFTEEDVKAIRKACGDTRMAHRNRALVELLIYTGQRIRGLITLRIKDVDVENGYIYLNEEMDKSEGGLKGALVRGRKRPMFGARKFVRDWLQYHPRGDDPDEWLFIGDPSHWKTDPDDHWATVSADHVLRRIGKYAEVDKPLNANNFRHYCATVLYRDYDLDRDTIRMLFGHVKGSGTLESTYSHLFDEDYINRAEAALGCKERERESPLTPDACPTCGELLEDHWRRCPACQEVFAPDLASTSDDVEDAKSDILDESFGRPEQLTAEELAGMRAILDVIDDPVSFAEQMTSSGEKA